MSRFGLRTRTGLIAPIIQGLQGSSVVTDGLVLNLDASNTASYPGTGTTWFDLSPSAYNATLVNGPTFSTLNGGCIVFDGVNDYATLGNILNYTTGSFSFSYWINASSIANSPVLFYKGAFSVSGYYHQISPDGSFALVVSQSGAYQFTNTVAGSITTNTWYNVAITRSGSSIKLYKNGVETTYATVGTISNPASSTDNFTISSYGSPSASGYLNGKIASFYGYNKALSGAEVLQNFNSTKGGFGY